MTKKKDETIKPGFMFYHNRRKQVQMLSLEDIGRFFLAALDYSEYGVLPDFYGEKDMLNMAFSMQIDDINGDEKRYNERVIQNTYANYCKNCKEDGEKKVSKTQWLKTEDGIACINRLSRKCLHMQDYGVQNPPIPTPTTMPVATPNTMAVATASTIPTEIASAIAKGMSASKNILQ